MAELMSEEYRSLWATVLYGIREGADQMPNVIGSVVGMNWFKERDQWIDGNNEPIPGMIIYFDWDDPEGEFGPQDGKPDHVGIVEKVVDGIIYTVEGNSGDAVRQNQYQVGEHVIMGFGVVEY